MAEMSQIFKDMTAEEEREWFARETAKYQEDVERSRLAIAQRKAADHYTNCRDCGHFVPKDLWVARASHDAIHRGLRPLCSPCLSEYDFEY